MKIACVDYLLAIHNVVRIKFFILWWWHNLVFKFEKFRYWHVIWMILSQITLSCSYLLSYWVSKCFSLFMLLPVGEIKIHLLSWSWYWGLLSWFFSWSWGCCLVLGLGLGDSCLVNITGNYVTYCIAQFAWNGNVTGAHLNSLIMGANSTIFFMFNIWLRKIFFCLLVTYTIKTASLDRSLPLPLLPSSAFDNLSAAH